jgi:membrane protein
LSWTIVLLGAEIARASEHYETFGFHPDYSRISKGSKKILMLKIFHLIVKRFAQGEKPLTTHQIAHALEIPILLVQQHLSEMTDAGLVVETAPGNSHEIAYQPGRSIEYITIQQALDLYEKRGETRHPTPASEGGEKISNLLKEISEAIEKSPANLKVKEI